MTDKAIKALAEKIIEIEIPRWSEDLREEFEERAAIMEYDGGLPRARAEVEAWRRLRGKHE